MFALYTVEEVSSYEHCQLYMFTMYTVIVGLLVVVGIVGNSFTFAVFWKGKFNKATSFLFMCLSLTDSAVLLTAFMIFSIPHFVNYVYSNMYTGYIHDLVDDITFFAVPVFSTAHTATMWVTVLIAINRYILVCRPLRASQWCTNSKLKKQLAAVLVSAVLYNIAVYAGMLMSAPFGPTVYLFISMNVLQAIFLLILPICILTVLNIRLIKAMKTHRRMQMQNQSSQNDDSITFVLVIVIVVATVCQLPQLSNGIVWLLSWHPVDNNYICGRFRLYLYTISNTLVVLNSAVNFIIYILVNKHFRDVLIQQVCKRRAPQQAAIAHDMAGVERERTTDL